MTRSCADVDVLRCANVPDVFPDPVQVSCHVIVCVDVIVRSVTSRYWNPHPSAGAAFPSVFTHGCPGPAHDTAGEPSPGSKVSDTGRAITRAQTPPARAVADSVRQVVASVQK